MKDKNTISQTAELFGCPRTPDPVILSDLPVNIVLADGAYRHGGEDGDTVLVCGGIQIDPAAPEDADVATKCFQWRPEDNVWDDEAFEDLNVPR